MITQSSTTFGVKPVLLALLFSVSLYGQELEERLYFQPGISVHHLFSNELFFDPPGDNFIQKVAYTPTFGLGYYHPQLNMGAEARYYRAAVTIPDASSEFLVVRSFFSLGGYYQLKKWKFSAFYSWQNYRIANFIISDFPLRGPFPFSLDKGMGIGVARTFGNFNVELTNKQLIGLSENSSSFFNKAFRGWNFTFTRDIYLKKTQANTRERTNTKNNFHFTVGAMLSGNELGGDNAPFVGVPNAKLFPTFGLEFRAENLNFSIYGRQGNWFSLEAAQDVGIKLNSQVRYAGLAYLHVLKNEHELKMGLHHVWNHTRGQQFLDYISNPPEAAADYEALNPLMAQNKGVGLDIRYALTRHFDVTTNVDWYYKAHENVGTGLNRESFRIGLLYNLY